MNIIPLIKKSILDLRGYFGLLLLASLPLSFLPLLIQQNKILGMLLLLIFSGPLKAGLSKISLAIVKKQTLQFSFLLEGFTYFKNSLGVFLLSLVFIIGGLFLLIIPGIIIGIWLSQSYFILSENPTMEPMEVFKKSKELIKGNEIQFFLIMLFFTSISLLLILSKLTLVSLLIVPLQYVTLSNFYQFLKHK
ncbi:hypothetical protein FHR24_000289 [Wenyingzhuangia heitensis]|uniref:Etoposide-induced protein 2.4 (EI24) n=1 Tax=Wenyingzhuangia heitensis TaxID=1487859 RepID=A0ABX0U798_9FLAO|nr:DUF975 family protein [Wenyingzhuangia heitensis]NIJ43850.1 hypothetical protein [Wenyingzhuangia heitensis]